MNYFKIGCRWDKKGKKGTNIEKVFEEYKAIFIGTDRPGVKLLNKVKINDRIVITDGYKIVGVAIINSDKKYLKDMNIKTPVDFKSFEHQKHLDTAIGFDETLVKLFTDDKDCLIYKNV